MSLKRTIALFGASSLMIAIVSLTSCTSMITEEQLAHLQDLRKQERQLNQDISNKTSEISKIETELNARKKVLNDCNKDKDFIQQKLSQWPNVWPDYTPVK